MNRIQPGRALISVSDKTGLAEFARGLARHGVKFLSTGGTATVLRDAGLSVRDVSDVTGYPELFEGRVKTLHPAVHGGILYRRRNDRDEEERHRHGIVSIDMVVVNLYPFERTVANPDVSDSEAVEQIDIGGPTLVRAAAKNYEDVIVVTDPGQYGEVLEALGREGGVPAALARSLARRAFEATAAYDRAIAHYFHGHEEPVPDGPPSLAAPRAAASVPGDLPEEWDQSLRLAQRLRYGENPGQLGAIYASGGEGGVAALTQIRGKRLSYNNLMDVEAALLLLHEFEEVGAVVVKHRSPSGVAVRDRVADAIAAAREGDELSAFGGVLGMNRTLDDAALDAIGDFFFEVVLAPSIATSADRLGSLRKSLIVLEVPDLLRASARGIRTRGLLDGVLAQTPPAAPDPNTWTCATARKPSEGERRDLIFGWKVTRHAISNAIVIARDGRTLGIGAGQSSRVDAVRLALLKAKRSGHDVRGATLCSDAFFPFSDSVELAAHAGIRAIAQPGGSVRDAESIAAAEAAGIAMLITGERCFLH